MKKPLPWISMGIPRLTFWARYSLTDKGSAEALATLEVLNPRGEIKSPPTLAPAPRFAKLAGRKIGLCWNGKPGGDNLCDLPIYTPTGIQTKLIRGATLTKGGR